MDSPSKSGVDNFDVKELQNELSLIEPAQETEKDPESKLNPLDIENILENILDQLDVNSLKSARLINKLWNVEGVKILIKKCFISLPEGYHFRNKTGKAKLRKQFQTFLNYKSFKIPHLKIEHNSDLPVFKSLNVLDEEIKEVKSLKWDSNEEDSPDCLEALLYKLPNLNYLDFDEECRHELTRVIMNFCVAKKNQQVKANQKPFIISNLGLFTDHNDLDSVERLEKFSQCEGVRIQNFPVCNLWILNTHPHLQNQFVQMINRFLERNKEILTRLKLISCQRYLSLLQFPKMSKLTKMQLSFFGSSQDTQLNFAYSFPPSFTFEDETPNLKSFNLRWESGLDERKEIDLWNKVFESTGPAPSVKEFDYADSSAGYNIDKFFKIFPNLEDFDGFCGHFESAATSIWKNGLDKIKSLKFLIVLEEQTTKISSFDSIFTGFTQQTVDSIKNSKDQMIPGVENLRVNPSILDLKGLETLEIDLIGGPCEKYLPRRILTVAKNYAFKLMPNVKIKIVTKRCTPTPKAALAALEYVSQLENVTVV